MFDFNKNPFEGVKVAVVGDAMVDRYIYGSVDRISPEAPIPVVRVTKRLTQLGGSGNVALNLSALGAVPLLVGRLGKDDLAEKFRQTASDEGVDHLFMVEEVSTPTTSKTRIIARSQQVVRFDEEDTSVLSEESFSGFVSHLEDVRYQADVVIVSDYGKGVICEKTLAKIKELWHDGLVLVDPKPRKAISYEGVHGMTPNFAEALALLDRDICENTDENAVKIAKELVVKFGLSHVLLTRSEAGMTLCGKNPETVKHLAAHAHEVMDVSGAGDTAIAIFAAALAKGLDIEQAMYFANIASSLVVTKLGTASVTWEEISQFMHDEQKAA